MKVWCTTAFFSHFSVYIQNCHLFRIMELFFFFSSQDCWCFPDHYWFPFVLFYLVWLCTGIIIKTLVGQLKLHRCTPVLTSITEMPFLPILLSLVSPKHCVFLALMQELPCYFWYAGRSPAVVASRHVSLFSLASMYSAGWMYRYFKVIYANFSVCQYHTFFSQDHFCYFFPLEENVYRQSRCFCNDFLVGNVLPRDVWKFLVLMKMFS